MSIEINYQSLYPVFVSEPSSRPLISLNTPKQDALEDELNRYITKGKELRETLIPTQANSDTSKSQNSTTTSSRSVMSLIQNLEHGLRGKTLTTKPYYRSAVKGVRETLEFEDISEMSDKKVLGIFLEEYKDLKDQYSGMTDEEIKKDIEQDEQAQLEWEQNKKAPEISRRRDGHINFDGVGVGSRVFLGVISLLNPVKEALNSWSWEIHS